MLQFDFLKNKYGNELLIDIGRIESLHGYIISEELHYITFYEILVITKGKGTFSLDGNSVLFSVGTVIVTLPNQIRHWKTDGDVEGFSFFFEGEFLNTYFRDELFLNRFHVFDFNRPSISVQLTEEQLQKCIWVFKEVEEEFEELKGDSSHIFRSLLYYSISQIDRFYQLYNHQSQKEADPNILRFKKLLDKHLKEWHTVAEYSNALGIGHNHLNDLCKSYFKQTALRTIHHRLLLLSKREISFSEKKISEISHELHFSDVSNFNRFFKKMTGEAPKAFRSKLTSQTEN
tara:strand:- start:71230 stop:72096 length:867 start_codon:yes stop_codon:yes gene_type:complete